MRDPADICKVFKLISNIGRLGILMCFAEREEMSPEDLAEMMQIREDVAWHNINLFMRAGLIVRRTKIGRTGYYGFSKIVRIEPDRIVIDASGLPVTIGRHLQEVSA